MRRTTVTVAADRADEALDVLLPALPAGVYEQPLGENVELAWLGDLPAGTVLGDLIQDTREDEVPDDPAERTAARALGFLIADRVLVRAPAHEPPDSSAVMDVVIAAETGAFGTGTHPTTRHCVELLLDVPPHPGGFADLGCGAGVLAIVAAKLGHEPVIAIDIEARSVAATQENAHRNGVNLIAMRLDLGQGAPPPVRALAANIPPAVHRALADQMPEGVESLLVSGITQDQVDEVRGGYTALGFEVVDERSDSGWHTLRMLRDAGW